jgi:Uri superfamily endonuclease
MYIPYPKTFNRRSTIRNGKTLSSCLRIRFSFTTRSTCSVLIKSCVNPLCYTHECITDLAALIDSKFHFYHHVDYIFSQIIRLLELILTTTFLLFLSTEPSDVIIAHELSLSYNMSLSCGITLDQLILKSVSFSASRGNYYYSGSCLLRSLWDPRFLITITG